MRLFLAMYGNEVSLGQSLFISVFAMIVVFVVLLIISYLIDFTAFCINGSKSKVANKVTTEVKPKIDKSSTKVDDSELVAVIAAVVASYLGTSVDNVMISKIRRIPQSNSPWAERGLLTQINKL